MKALKPLDPHRKAFQKSLARTAPQTGERESVERFLARGGRVTVCAAPPVRRDDDVIRPLRDQPWDF